MKEVPIVYVFGVCVCVCLFIFVSWIVVLFVLVVSSSSSSSRPCCTHLSRPRLPVSEYCTVETLEDLVSDHGERDGLVNIAVSRILPKNLVKLKGSRGGGGGAGIGEGYVSGDTNG